MNDDRNESPCTQMNQSFDQFKSSWNESVHIWFRSLTFGVQVSPVSLGSRAQISWVSCESPSGKIFDRFHGFSILHFVGNTPSPYYSYKKLESQLQLECVISELTSWSWPSSAFHPRKVGLTFLRAKIIQTSHFTCSGNWLWVFRLMPKSSSLQTRGLWVTSFHLV